MAHSLPNLITKPAHQDRFPGSKQFVSQIQVIIDTLVIDIIYYICIYMYNINIYIKDEKFSAQRQVLWIMSSGDEILNEAVSRSLPHRQSGYATHQKPLRSG